MKQRKWVFERDDAILTTLVWINPKSRQGGGDERSWMDGLNDEGGVRVHSAAEDDISAVIREIPGLSRIIVAGGDGTLNIALPAIRQANVPVGIIPLGTANDFARSLELPLNPMEAVKVILAGKTRRVDLGEANGRLFLNAAGVGLGPALTRKLDEDGKRRLGVLAYLKGLCQVVGRTHVHRAVLILDQREIAVRFIQLTVANGIHYGGGMTIAEEADLEDGHLDVLCLGPQTIPQLLGKAAALRRGASRKQDNGKKMCLFSAERVEIRTARPFDVTLDGEITTRTPLICQCLAGAIEVFSPADRRHKPARESAPAA